MGRIARILDVLAMLCFAVGVLAALRMASVVLGDDAALAPPRVIPAACALGVGSAASEAQSGSETDLGAVE